MASMCGQSISVFRKSHRQGKLKDVVAYTAIDLNVKENDTVVCAEVDSVGYC